MVVDDVMDHERHVALKGTPSFLNGMPVTPQLPGTTIKFDRLSAQSLSGTTTLQGVHWHLAIQWAPFAQEKTTPINWYTIITGSGASWHPCNQ